MALTTNKRDQSLQLTFFDGSSLSYTFGPGELTYDSESGLIVAFEIQMSDGSTEEITLCARPSKLNADIMVTQFLAPFGAAFSAGKIIAKVAGKSNVYTSFAGFLLGSPVGGAISNYLQELKNKNSSYYTLDEHHLKLRIREPMYIHV